VRTMSISVNKTKCWCRMTHANQSGYDNTTDRVRNAIRSWLSRILDRHLEDCPRQHEEHAATDERDENTQRQIPAYKIETGSPEEIHHDAQVGELKGKPHVRPAGPHLEPAAHSLGEIQHGRIDVRHPDDLTADRDGVSPGFR
jgi:hypothetical protein